MGATSKVPDFQVTPIPQHRIGSGSPTLQDLLSRIDVGGRLSPTEGEYLVAEVRHHLAKLHRVEHLAQTYANSLTKISLTVHEEVMATRRAE